MLRTQGPPQIVPWHEPRFIPEHDDPRSAAVYRCLVGSWSVAKASDEGWPTSWARRVGHSVKYVVRLARRPVVQDAAVAVLAALVGGLAQSVASSGVEPWVYWGIVAVCCATLLVRNRMPRVCLTILAALMLLHQMALHQPSAFAATICIIAAYTTQTRLAPPWRWSYLVVIYMGTAWAILTSTEVVPGAVWPNRAAVAMAAWAVITITVLVGSIQQRNRMRTELAAERAAILEGQYEMAQRLAAAEERTRIAREMHDILGHSLNAIAVQAEGARYVIRSDSERADRALADIGRLSRTAVDEVHDLLNVLRTEDDRALQRPMHTLNEQRPTPTLNDLGTLVGSFQHSSSTVRLRVDGELSTVPPQVSVAAYRVVQESLTNAIRHADRAPVAIRISVGTRQVRLLIINGPPANPTQTLKQAHTHGHGIIGMRERIRALGGQIDVGPDPTTGGWRVSATVPWRAA